MRRIGARVACPYSRFNLPAVFARAPQQRAAALMRIRLLAMRADRLVNSFRQSAARSSFLPEPLAQIPVRRIRKHRDDHRAPSGCRLFAGNLRQATTAAAAEMPTSKPFFAGKLLGHFVCGFGFDLQFAIGKMRIVDGRAQSRCPCASILRARETANRAGS